eukprot:5308680-Amphidinium_carterae.1
MKAENHNGTLVTITWLQTLSVHRAGLSKQEGYKGSTRLGEAQKTSVEENDCDCSRRSSFLFRFVVLVNKISTRTGTR